MKDEWTESYALILPMMGLVVAVAGLGLSLITLRSQAGVSGMQPPTGVDVDVPKVRYSEGNIFVEVREPGKWHRLTEFVQPDNPAVMRTVLGAF